MNLSFLLPPSNCPPNLGSGPVWGGGVTQPLAPSGPRHRGVRGLRRVRGRRVFVRGGAGRHNVGVLPWAVSKNSKSSRFAFDGFVPPDAL